MESDPKPCTDQVLMALKALKKASKDLESDDAAAGVGGDNSPSMKALLTLQTGSTDLFSGDPRLSALSLLLSRLKSLSAGGGLLRRRSGGAEISRVASSIGSELQSWIDRESTARLLAPSAAADDEEEERCAFLLALQTRASRGFDHALQDVLLRCNAYSAVESALASPSSSKRVRDAAAGALLALVRFNRDVFVGPVLMGPAIRSLVSSASPAAMKALAGLIAAVRSPVVDELHARGEIPRIAALLGELVDDEVRVLALDAVLEIGYHGRKEAVDRLLEEGIVERLMALQRSELGGALIDGDGYEGVRAGGVRKGEVGESRRPFAGCVARFAVQMEVGEGLRQRERRAVRVEVVRRVRAAAVAGEEAESATVLAEVLWGSTYW